MGGPLPGQVDLSASNADHFFIRAALWRLGGGPLELPDCIAALTRHDVLLILCQRFLSCFVLVGRSSFAGFQPPGNHLMCAGQM